VAPAFARLPLQEGGSTLLKVPDKEKEKEEPGSTRLLWMVDPMKPKADAPLTILYNRCARCWGGCWGCR
jgi:hypothetical protein